MRRWPDFCQFQSKLENFGYLFKDHFSGLIKKTPYCTLDTQTTVEVCISWAQRMLFGQDLPAKIALLFWMGILRSNTQDTVAHMDISSIQSAKMSNITPTIGADLAEEGVL